MYWERRVRHESSPAHSTVGRPHWPTGAAAALSHGPSVLARQASLRSRGRTLPATLRQLFTRTMTPPQPQPSTHPTPKTLLQNEPVPIRRNRYPTNHASTGTTWAGERATAFNTCDHPCYQPNPSKPTNVSDNGRCRKPMKPWVLPRNLLNLPTSPSQYVAVTF